MLIECINNLDRGVTLKDGNGVWKKFDRYGKFVMDNNKLSVKEISSAVRVKVVSVLTSGGICEVAVFDENGMTRYNGSLNTVMNIFNKRVFFKMLKLSFEIDGLRANQTLFLYNSETDMEDIIKCI